jgi:hypothetical protein
VRVDAGHSRISAECFTQLVSAVRLSLQPDILFGVTAISFAPKPLRCGRPKFIDLPFLQT